MNHSKLSAGETAGTYRITDMVTEAELLGIAKAFARRRLARERKITQPALAFEYLQVLLQDYEHEIFSALFLDSQHRVIRFEGLFRGTIDSASVYPREVVKLILRSTGGHRSKRSFEPRRPLGWSSRSRCVGVAGCSPTQCTRTPAVAWFLGS